MKRKTLAILLAMTLGVAAVTGTGCGSSTDNSESDTESVSEAAETETEAVDAGTEDDTTLASNDMGGDSDSDEENGGSGDGSGDSGGSGDGGSGSGNDPGAGGGDGGSGGNPGDGGGNGGSGGGSGMGDAPGGSGGGSSSGVDSYDAVVEYTEDTEVDGETYTSTGSDENAILSNGASLVLKNITVDRTSSNSTGGDNSSFYGVGAAVLTLTGTTTISNATITTDAAGGAGVFAYGDAVVYVSDSTITTTQDTSGGIHAAGGGTLYAWGLTVETSGESSAAIRSDRGGGTMVVDGGSYTSNGTGSPAVYCTADIVINDATLISTNSEAVCIEGLNTLRIFDSDLSGAIHDSSQNDCSWNIILYQSMSGDSEVGNSTFEMQGGSITASNGGMFYTTNTESTFILKDVDITYAEENDFFLKVTGNSNERGWGSSGSNGAQCTFTAIDQEMEGAVIWDSISTLDFYMTDGSTLTGYVEDDESNAGSGGSGYCKIYIDSTSAWVVTGDSVLTALYNEGTIVDEDGKTVAIVGSDGSAYVSGTSSYTITVDSYGTTADFSGASAATAWEDYEVEEP